MEGLIEVSSKVDTFRKERLLKLVYMELEGNITRLPDLPE